MCTSSRRNQDKILVATRLCAEEGMTGKDILGLGIVVAALIAAYLVAGVLRVRGAVSPEGSRKIVHVAMGATALCFPVLFDSPVPPVGLAAAVGIGLVAQRAVPLLRRSIGFVVLDIDRASYGEIAFLVGVTLLFCLTFGRPLLYEAPIAVLTVADPLATVVGRRFGVHRFTVFGSTKSLEGSTAFFVAALVCIVQVSRFGHQPAPLGMLAAIGLVLTLVEIGSPHGLDNVTLPLAGGWLLGALTAI
jgi:phytol kinase